MKVIPHIPPLAFANSAQLVVIQNCQLTDASTFELGKLLESSDCLKALNISVRINSSFITNNTERVSVQSNECEFDSIIELLKCLNKRQILEQFIFESDEWLPNELESVIGETLDDNFILTKCKIGQKLLSVDAITRRNNQLKLEKRMKSVKVATSESSNENS